jgi:hypothetical protein
VGKQTASCTIGPDTKFEQILVVDFTWAGHRDLEKDQGYERVTSIDFAASTIPEAGRGLVGKKYLT